MPPAFPVRGFIGALAVACGAGCFAAPAAAQAPDVAPSLDSLLAVKVHAAARHAQALADAPAAASVITAAEIAAFGGRTLADVLARVPGFHITYDHNYTYVGVRGFGRPTDYNNRILVLLDGVPLNDGVYDGAAMGTDLALDLDALQRIEIVRGPGSALYGGNAMTAVINLVTKVPAQNGMAVSVEGGGYRHVRVAAQGSVLLPGDVAVFASAFGGRDAGRDLFLDAFADGTRASGLVAGRDGDRYGGGFISARMSGLTLRARAGTRNKDVPTGSWFTVPTDPRNETTDESVLLAADYSRAISERVELAATASFDHYRYLGTYAWADDVLYDATDSHRRFAQAILTFDPKPSRRLLVGVAVTDYSRADYRTMYESGAADTIDFPHHVYAVFSQAELHVTPEVTVTVGGRLDASDGQRAHLTPRAAVLLRPAAGTTFKLIHGDAFRAPNLYERSYPSGAAVARGRIDPERVRTGEAVLEQRVGAGSLRLSAFASWYSRLIDSSYEPETELSLYDNVGSARTHGVEAELTAPAGGWLVRLGGVLLAGEEDEEGKDRPLLNAPARSAVAGASGPLAGPASAAFQLRAESGRLALDGSRTSAHALLDAGIGVAITSRLRATLRSVNVLDTQYAHPAGPEHRQPRMPQKGRSLSIRVEYAR